MTRVALAVVILVAHALASTNDFRIIKRVCRDDGSVHATFVDVMRSELYETLTWPANGYGPGGAIDPLGALPPGNPIACANAHLRYRVFYYSGENLDTTASLGFDTVQSCVRNGVHAWLSYADLPIVAGVYNEGFAAFIDDLDAGASLAEAFNAHFTCALEDGRFADAVAMVGAMKDDVENMHAGVRSAIISAAERNEAGIIHSLFVMCGRSIEYVGSALAPAAVAAVESQATDALTSILDAISAHGDMLKHVSINALVKAVETDDFNARQAILGRQARMADRECFLDQAMHIVSKQRRYRELLVEATALHAQGIEAVENYVRNTFPELRDAVLSAKNALHTCEPIVAKRVTAGMRAAIHQRSILRRALMPSNERDVQQNTAASLADASSLLVRAATAGEGLSVISALRFIAANPMAARDSVNAAIANAQPYSDIAPMLVMAADYCAEYISIETITDAATHAASVGVIRQVAFMIDVCPDDATRMRVGRAALRAAYNANKQRIVEYLAIRLGPLLRGLAL